MRRTELGNSRDPGLLLLVRVAIMHELHFLEQIHQLKARIEFKCGFNDLRT
jgi:hypothetical protein